jgi:Asp-tRNA(Asn)/Glu-tRNA(Gln) amidotransferase A subunit family amidase
MSLEKWTELSVTQLAALLKARRASPLEVIEAYLRRIDSVNPVLNALVTISPDLLDQARHADAVLARDETLGPLHGVPVTIKDTIETAGLLTTSGTRTRSNYVPPRDAAAVARLRAAGAIILGKTNTPEMAIPYETDNPIFGRTNNPYDPQRTCGGSSGGEAAAIAACLSPTGLGSDLSGSIRVPAHFCGIVGLKPTSGRIPMEGHFPSSIKSRAFGACIGPMARRVEDLSLLFDVLVNEQSETTSAKPELSLRGVRIAWYDNDGVSPVTAETKRAVQAAARALELAGLEVNAERPPGIEIGSRLWIDLFSSASAEQIRHIYSGREEEAGPLVAKILGASIEPQTREKRERVMLERNNLCQTLLTWMKTTPLILAPVGAAPAFAHGARRLDVAGESISVFHAFSYSQVFNVFDLPSVVVPAGRSPEGLPVGVQIVGRPFEERAVLAAASIVEEALGGWQPPPLFDEL